MPIVNRPDLRAWFVGVIIKVARIVLKPIFG